MASEPDQPPAGPSRLADRLARHPWIAAAGMTATVAAVAGGGLALVWADGAPGPPKQCGLVPCAAALPASVKSSGEGPARATVTAAPTAAHRVSTPSPAPSPTSPARPAPAPPVSAPPVSAPSAAAPETAVPVVQPATAGLVPVPDPRSSCTTVIAFIARGPLSPVRCTLTEAARQPRNRAGAGHRGSGQPRSGAGQDTSQAGGQLGSARRGHEGWLGNWLSGWLSRGWSGSGWSGSGGPGQHGGWPGQGGGWPGGR